MPLILETLPYSLHPSYAILATLALSFLIRIVFAQSSEPAVKSKYPYVGDEQRYLLFKGIRQRLYWFKNGPSIIHSAFEEHRDTIFTLPSLDRTSIVLPPRFLHEIKTLPSTICTNSEATSDFFIGKWTTLDYDIFGHANIDSIKAQFITKIGAQIEPASDEAAYAFHQHFPPCPDWTPIDAQPRILQIVSCMVARTVIGPEACRNPKWNSSVIGYAQNVFGGAVLLKLIPNILHPLAVLCSPYFYRIRMCRWRIKKLAAPIIQQRMAWKRDNPTSWKTHLREDKTITVDWLVENSPPHEATVAMMAHRLTGVSFGASHTTSNTITNAIIDLASDFGRWAPALREEISSVLGTKSKVTNADLSNMWKLDSFLKESQRFHPPSKLSVNRKMLQSYTLSSGDELPKGAHVCLAGVPMSMSDDYFEKAEEFDGFRFERLRQDPKTDHNGLQFTSSYEGSLHFGNGKYMCPGRFMGSMICKLLLIELLQRYDLKLKEQTLPRNIMFFDMDVPNPKYEVLFRDRAD